VKNPYLARVEVIGLDSSFRRKSTDGEIDVRSVESEAPDGRHAVPHLGAVKRDHEPGSSQNGSEAGNSGKVGVGGVDDCRASQRGTEHLSHEACPIPSARDVAHSGEVTRYRSAGRLPIVQRNGGEIGSFSKQ
jgi:hypothetical protein